MGLPAPHAIDFAALAQCLTAIGSAEFPRIISDYCMRLCKADAAYVCAVFDESGPVPLYSSYTEPHIAEIMTIYTEFAYVLDPLFTLFKAKRGDEALGFADFAPDDFRKSEYYNRFYKALGLTDECAFVVHVSGSAALIFSFGTRSAGRKTVLTGLKTALPLLAAMVRRHWPILTPTRVDGSGNRTAFLDLAFENFGTSLLSPREAEISRHIIRGYSNKTIARELKCSPETVKVHRKHIYAKLNIQSQGDLFALLMSALKVTPATSKEDPLIHFFAAQAASPLQRA